MPTRKLIQKKVKSSRDNSIFNSRASVTPNTCCYTLIFFCNKLIFYLLSSPPHISFLPLFEIYTLFSKFMRNFYQLIAGFLYIVVPWCIQLCYCNQDGRTEFEHRRSWLSWSPICWEGATMAFRSKIGISCIWLQ